MKKQSERGVTIGSMSYMKSLTAGEFQRQCFEEILDFLKLLRIQESQQEKFTKREPTALLIYMPISKLYETCKEELTALLTMFPSLAVKIEQPLFSILDDVYAQSANGLQLLDAYGAFADLKAKNLQAGRVDQHTYLELSASKSRIFINLKMEEMMENRGFSENFQDSLKNKQYLFDIMRLCQDARERSRNFKPSESCGVWSAYTLIKKGTTLDFAYRGLGTSGFREGHHTLIFTTDPGDDHIRITSHSKEMMNGIAAHVEHIDRDKVSSKELVEAYRLPAAINAAKVRLHIGDSVPVTAFIGRPVFENGNADKNKPTESYEMDQLKSVHMSASACSAMFQNGVADCKLAIERMYLKDAVAFMKSVVGNVFRTLGKQTLAAAFNINTPYYDNLYHATIEDEESYMVNDRFEIAQMAIKAAVDGGFDRVTWDGASNQIPSEPIINQLTHQQFTFLVHTAHENGLQTYFSAGLEAEHVERCVYTGVDGLGIGTSLHFIDPDTKLMGAFDPKAIKAVLDARDHAEDTQRGKAAILLARMDRLHFETLLSEAEEMIREQLYQAVCHADEVLMSSILKDERLQRVIEMELLDGNTILNRGERTLAFAKQNRKAFDTIQIERLEKSIKNHDVELLGQLFAEVQKGR